MELNREQILEFKQFLRNNISFEYKKTWINSLEFLKITTNKVILGGIKHKVYCYEIKTNHEPLIIKILDKLFPENSPFSKKTFEYKIGKIKKKKNSIQAEFDFNQIKTTQFSKKTDLNHRKDLNVKKSRFSRNCHNILNTFLPGERNLLASRASKVVVEMPGIAFNPFIIYGDSGAGKTHLLEGICNGIIDSDEKFNTIYITAENFLNDFINNLRSNKMNEFRDIYRKTDAFLLDDLEALLPSEKCQNELLHTLKALHKKKSQIVIVSQDSPTQIAGLNIGLKNFLESGLTVDLGIPDNETKVNILESKAFERGIPVSNELLNFLVGNIKGGISRLEGALMRLGVHASLLNEKLTISLAKFALKDWLDEHQQNQRTKKFYKGKHIDQAIENIFEKIKIMFNVTEEELLSYKREKKYIKARHATVFILKNITSLSLNEIGKILGRNHSTIHSILKKVKERMLEDEFFNKQMHILIEELKEKQILETPSTQKQEGHF